MTVAMALPGQGMATSQGGGIAPSGWVGGVAFGLGAGAPLGLRCTTDLAYFHCPAFERIAQRDVPRKTDVSAW